MINWILFIPACFLLNCAPGPNNLLAFTNAARGGAGLAMIGSLGRIPAFTALLALTVIGLGTVLSQSAFWFVVIKYIGAAYLAYVGLRMLWTAGRIVIEQRRTLSLREAFRNDFTIAITNPKAIAIFTAFFPQFITPDGDTTWQLAQMGGAFLLMEVAAIVLYVGAGAALAGFVKGPKPFVWLQRIVGTALVGSGVSMALTSK